MAEPGECLDVNHDRIINFDDAVLLDQKLQAQGSPSPVSPVGPVDDYWDTSGDDLISQLDLDILAQHLAGRRASLRQNSQAAGEGEESFSVTIDPEDTIYEGQMATIHGVVSPPGYYTVDGGVDWGELTFPIDTDASGAFSVQILLYDDGPSPGNGTASDEVQITMTVWPMGSPELAATDSAMVTVHNIAPEPQLEVLGYMPTGGRNWELRGLIHDVGTLDWQDVTIDWGDGTPPTIMEDLIADQEFMVTHEYAPTGPDLHDHCYGRGRRHGLGAMVG